MRAHDIEKLLRCFACMYYTVGLIDFKKITNFNQCVLQYTQSKINCDSQVRNKIFVEMIELCMCLDILYADDMTSRAESDVFLNS